MMFYLLIIAVAFYLAWALVFHIKDKSLTLVTYLEYVLTAALAITIMLGLFL